MLVWNKLVKLGIFVARPSRAARLSSAPGGLWLD